jgi:hypothetical protein
MYASHERSLITGDVPFAKYFLKGLAFKHEEEYRALAPLPELLSDDGASEDRDPGFSGVNVEIALSDLVEEIVVCPTAPSWFIIAARGLVDLYKLKCPLRVSALSRLPSF